MCGIAGIISLPHRKGSPENDLGDIQKMADALAHRGPDGAGTWQNATNLVFFGHRRLAVIDTSSAAAQPMHYGNRFSIVYNGEVYNYREIRETLLSLGHQFSTQSDTEVILAAFAQYRENCLQYFDGMFALAIWDEVEQCLFMARDRFGEKPFFFHQESRGRFLFASEMKAFQAIGIERIPDESQALLFLATGQTSFPLAPDQTFYKNIFQLPAAHFAWLRPEGGDLAVTSSRYWDIDTRREYAGSHQQAAEELTERLSASVRMRLRSDVPVGSSLSGGVDSGSIAALLGKEKPAKFQGFSAVFPGYEKDESANIEMLSRRCRLESHHIIPTGDDLLRDFDTMVWHQEEPIGSASVFAQYQVFALAKKLGVTVLLDGQGADEILAGYEQYIPWFLQEKWRSAQWATYRKEKHQFRDHGVGFAWGLRNYVAALFPQAAQSQLSDRQFQAISRVPMVNPEYAATFSKREFLYKPLVTNLNDLLYFDVTMGRLPELLRYADRNSMAHGREVRLPFLQHEMVQWLFTLPAGYKIKDGYTKWLLRKSMENELPEEIAWQTRKIAFEPPQQQWMQIPAIQDRIIESRKQLAVAGILDKKRINQIVRPSAANAMKAYDWRYWALAALY